MAASSSLSFVMASRSASVVRAATTRRAAVSTGGSVICVFFGSAMLDDALTEPNDAGFTAAIYGRLAERPSSTAL